MNQAVLFGEHDHLMGVWCAPDSTLSIDALCDGESQRECKTAVIFVTAGMLASSGPCRLHVDLANELCDLGIASLRFDLSGIGESLGVGSGGRSIDRAANEIRQAVDWISENSSADKVVLFGLCSGADDAIQAAVQEDRVVGVVAMDGCGYRTPMFHWHRLRTHYLPRLLRVSKWIDLVRRRFRPEAEAPSSLQMGSDVREFPDRDEAVRQLRGLLQRDVRLHFIYTGGVGDYYNHQGQFVAMFPELRGDHRLTHRFFPQLDHVAFLCEDRARLTSHIVRTLARFCEVASAGSAARELETATISFQRSLMTP